MANLREPTKPSVLEWRKNHDWLDYQYFETHTLAT